MSVDPAYARDRELDLSVADDEEEAEFWALTDAAMMSLGLRADGPRFVLAARVRPDQLRPDGPEGSGRVVAEAVTWSQVTALFIDEDEAQPAIDRARAALGQPDRFAELVGSLVAEHDLLWYAPDELDGLLDGSG